MCIYVLHRYALSDPGTMHTPFITKHIPYIYNMYIYSKNNLLDRRLPSLIPIPICIPIQTPTPTLIPMPIRRSYTYIYT